MGQGKKNAIKRAARAAGISAKEMGRKMREAEERRAEAVRRNTMDRIVTMSASVLEVWSMGLRGGGEKEYAAGNAVFRAAYPPLDIKGREKAMAAMRLGSLLKARIPVAAGILGKGHGMSFHGQAAELVNDLQDIAWEELSRYGLQSDTAQARAVAYALFAVTWAWAKGELCKGADPGKDFLNFLSRFRCFADWIIPEGSPLCLPMSDAFARIRDRALGRPGKDFWRMVDEGTPMEGWDDDAQAFAGQEAKAASEGGAA